jgi:Tol biopolymer transport system component
MLTRVFMLQFPALLAAVVAISVMTGGAGSSAQTNGMLLFATGGDGVSDKLEIAGINPDGSGFHKLTHHSAPGFSPKWSTDGRRVIFETEDSFTGNAANWRMRADGSHRQRLPSGGWDVPSPDGDLVHEYDRIVDAHGKIVRRLRPGLGRDDVYGSAPLWSPNGRYIAISVFTETQRSDYAWVDVVPTTEGGRGLFVTPRRKSHYEDALSWSPSSGRLLIEVSRGRTSDWYSVAPDGSDRRLVLRMQTKHYRDHTWSPDSRRIAYVGQQGGIFVISAIGGRPRRVAATKSRGSDAGDVSLDWSSRGDPLHPLSLHPGRSGRWRRAAVVDSGVDASDGACRWQRRARHR